jgi:quercetin dioxygenase-like cupin family protein
MTREQRWKNTGALFCVVFVTALLLTNSGMQLVQGLQGNVDLSGVALTIFGLGLAFFTSESIGFLFSSLSVFLFWNAKGGRKPGFGGYSTEWRRLTYDFKGEIVKRYQTTAAEPGPKEQTSAVLRDSWEHYTPDVFLSYFWQQAPLPLVEWVSRRHSAFFSGLASILAIGVALLLSAGLIIGFGMGWTTGTVSVFVVSAVLAMAFGYNAQAARTEAWQMIDLWMRGAFDPKMQKAIRDIMKRFTVKQEETDNSKPSFKVMRVNDVKVRSRENDQRLYYFDSDVDMVATTISKRHVEPSHLHTRATETYYVIRGRLLVNVEGQDIWLNEGDLILVNSGACHHFETTEETVMFLATKRESGLGDKKLC